MLDTHSLCEIYGFISLWNLHQRPNSKILKAYISDPLETNGVVMMMPARFSQNASDVSPLCLTLAPG